jgi:5-methylcytosine-specific restriction enzyme A
MPACELCRREGEVTTHHLMPRTRRKSKKNKQDFTRDGVKGRPVDLCRLCHKRVHMLTHKEAEEYF